MFASADPLHQVCLNLVINAQQAPQGQASPRRLRVRTVMEDGLVAVEIADNGPGIPADIQKRIFDPFFTTKPMGVGTGIGLSVRRGIAELLAEILGRAGHEVSIVANGGAALDWLAAGAPELVISDLRMPGMDGPTLYRRLAAEHPDLLRRMLFITGDGLSPDLSAFLSETGVPVIEKPYDPHDVVRKVESALKPAA